MGTLLSISYIKIIGGYMSDIDELLADEERVARLVNAIAQKLGQPCSALLKPGKGSMNIQNRRTEQPHCDRQRFLQELASITRPTPAQQGQMPIWGPCLKGPSRPIRTKRG